MSNFSGSHAQGSILNSLKKNSQKHIELTPKLLNEPNFP